MPVPCGCATSWWRCSAVLPRPGHAELLWRKAGEVQALVEKQHQKQANEMRADSSPQAG